MKKTLIRLALGLGAAAAVVAGSSMFAAMQAAVVNVTAEIENALTVDPKALDFGTVFPQEYLEETLDISLSDSFLEEDRVNNIRYVIKQKPKVKLFNPQTQDPNLDPVPGDPYETITVGPFTGPAWKYCEENLPPDSDLADNIGYTVDLSDPYWQYCYLPLANALSKHETTTDGTVPENDVSVDAYHQAYLWSGNPLVSSLDPQFIAHGYLAKDIQDIQDSWVIDLKVPCFYNQCAQEADDPLNLPKDQIPGFEVPGPFRLDPKTEHKTFGTDLWIEVTEISLSNGTPPPPPPNPPPPPPPAPVPPPPPVEPPPPPPPATITVTKVVTNNNGGNAQIADFQLFVDATGVVSGVSNNFAPGVYTISEIGVFGYAASFAGDCDAGTHQITLVAGDNKTCTITNDDIAPVITLIKSVVNDDGGSAQPQDFIMTVDGTPVPTGSSIAVTANVAHAIDENAKAGYTFSGMTGAGCPGALGGTVTPTPGQSVTCTITNDDNDVPPQEI